MGKKLWLLINSPTYSPALLPLACGDETIMEFLPMNWRGEGGGGGGGGVVINIRHKGMTSFQGFGIDSE